MTSDPDPKWITQKDMDEWRLDEQRQEEFKRERLGNWEPDEDALCRDNGHVYYGDHGGMGSCHCGAQLYTPGGARKIDEREAAQIETRKPADYPCASCGGPTLYQLGSGGKEWVCTACAATGEYDLNAPSLPRAVLFQTEQGRIALRAQMDQRLAELRGESPPNL